MKIDKYIPGAVLKEHTLKFDEKTMRCKEEYITKPAENLIDGIIKLEAEILEIPYYGGTLRITVSEWGSVELIKD